MFCKPTGDHGNLREKLQTLFGIKFDRIEFAVFPVLQRNSPVESPSLVFGPGHASIHTTITHRMADVFKEVMGVGWESGDVDDSDQQDDSDNDHSGHSHRDAIGQGKGLQLAESESLGGGRGSPRMLVEMRCLASLRRRAKSSRTSSRKVSTPTPALANSVAA